ncbi:MAG TPA: rhodanese-like domain-containing protein [Bacteroidales bacterium]|nr:rhodanese-like domain-containing protein [Bacteroidales bacterium]
MNTTDNPEIQIFQLNGVKHIRSENVISLVRENKMCVIDVREEAEFKSEYIDCENILSHPMSVIMDRLAYIPKNTPLLIVSSDGVNSTKVANLLNIQGFIEVVNLDGGLNAWKIKGFKTVKNVGYNSSNSSQSCNKNTCGCSCEGCE